MQKANGGDGCVCDLVCPRNTSCACIYVIDVGSCTCECSGRGGGSYDSGRGLSLDTPVSVNATGISLSRFGAFLNGLCDAEILIPAASVRKRVSLTLKDTTLEAVIRKAGLVVSDKHIEIAE